MANLIKVQLASPKFGVSNSKETEILLYDDVGPLNSWEPTDSTSFTITGKSTMVWHSSTKIVDCRGGGLAPVIVLKEFDLDKPQISEQKKPAENNDSGDFPTGECEWMIVEVS